MKHTIIAGCLLILILLIVVMNAVFVRGVTDELYAQLKELPTSRSAFDTDGSDYAESFFALWNEKRGSLSLSIHEDELDRIDDAAAELCGAAKSGDFETYCAARERLFTFVPTLADGEKPTFRTLF